MHVRSTNVPPPRCYSTGRVSRGSLHVSLGAGHSGEWSKANASLVETTAQAERALRAAERAQADATASLESLLAGLRKTEGDLAISEKQMAQLALGVEAHRRTLGNRLIDQLFFAHAHESKHLATPWVPDSLHRKREDLFIAALAVHRAFIDAAAQKIYHNLSILMDVLAGGPPKDDAKRKLLGDLWATLFLIVPVVSTTFASVERMLGDLPSGSIGWLLIDEAGQALPQAAVGAIMRAKRSVVVGDPMQISPVVTLPERLTSEICRFFKVAAPSWAAPEASAQTLADRASKFQAVFGTNESGRRVGIPLLVHRRCQEPMFSISNQIAYDNNMVFGTPALSPEFKALLGASRWFDLSGTAATKWCPAEGNLVTKLIARLAAEPAAPPDLFVITPFRIVAQELREQLADDLLEIAAFSDIDLPEWVKDRVGTIHTVQGREADTVILVLGAPNSSQDRARIWAAGTSPNIINVAVSRAKARLYVVGSHGAWSGLRYGRDLAKLTQERVRILR